METGAEESIYGRKYCETLHERFAKKPKDAGALGVKQFQVCLVTLFDIWGLRYYNKKEEDKE